MVTSRGTGQVPAVPRALFISAEPFGDQTNIRNIQLFDIWAPLWPSMTWASRAQQAGGWGLGLSLAAAPGTPKHRHLQHQCTSPSRWCEEGVGELGGEQTNLYKLQSYYIYSAQAEPEPWGVQDGNNLRSRFAWSYAAFGRSDTVSAWGGPGTATPVRQVPRPCCPRGAWPLLLAGRDSRRRGGGIGYSWSSQSLRSLGRSTGMCLCHQGWYGSPLSASTWWFHCPFPFLNTTGKGKDKGWGLEMLKMTSCHPWGCSARPGDAREAQGHGWVQGLGRMWEMGDQGVADAEVMLSLPLSAIFHATLNIKRKHHCCITFPLTLGQSKAALAGRGLIQD